MFANGTVTLDDAVLSSVAGGIAIGANSRNGPSSPAVGAVTASAGSQITSLITRLAWNPNTTGSLTLTGAGTTWSDVATAGGPADSGSSYIGASGQATLLIEAGAAMNEADDGVLGFAPNADGVVTVEGANSTWTIAQALTVGDSGTGSVTIESGGKVSAATAIIGNASASNGTLTVDAGGALDVTGAIDLGAQAGATGALTVSGTGASVTAADLDVGGTLTASGGAATATIGSGGQVTVTQTNVWTGGQIQLAGGTLTTDPIAVAPGGLISGWGVLTGGLTNDGTITATGGLLDITGPVTNDGTLGEENGGVLDVASAVDGSGSAVIQTGTLELGGSFAEDVSFTAGDAGTLQIDHYALFGGTISGFTVGDTIDLADVKYDPAWTAGIEPNSNNVLQFVENGTTYTLDLDPADDFVGHDFLLSSIDGGAGTAITVGQVTITGTVTIPAGETASDVVVGNGGELIVAPGGSETGATVTNGGTLNVENDASASGGTVSSGGTLNVSSGGTASGITVSDGGHQYVESGGTANDTVLTDPGIQIVVSGGTASNTVDGGEQDVYGSAVSTIVVNGGLEIVETGGFATGTTVSSTGDLTVDSGGVVAGDTLMTAGGEAILDAGAVVSSGASFSFSGVGNTLQIDGPALRSPSSAASSMATQLSCPEPSAARSA